MPKKELSEEKRSASVVRTMADTDMVIQKLVIPFVHGLNIQNHNTAAITIEIIILPFDGLFVIIMQK